MAKSNKLWDKGFGVEKAVEQFTVGDDKNLDLLLAEFDVLGSIAHAVMLESVGILTKEELEKLKSEMVEIYGNIKEGLFKIADGIEDIHSQIELNLTKKFGEIGKKIHTGRSRNDQVMLDLRLFTRFQIQNIVADVRQLFDLLINLSGKHKDVLMPGYTHFQVAMPSSFGLWFGAFAESLVDDLVQLKAAYDIVDRNPLGSAAGYGSGFPLNRNQTTQLMGFSDLNYNSVYAQMCRGRMEKIVSQALASLAETMSALAMDITLFLSQNFNFISFPENLTTGSSIMPHKKNPDLFELIRARCNRIKALPNEINAITSNLPTGYHRDYQLVKEKYLPVFAEISTCLRIMHYALKQIKVNKNILDDSKYDFLFSVEGVNELVKKGISFRDAYREIGKKIAEGQFSKPTDIKYTHEGSIGNLCNDKIQSMMETVIQSFDFEKANKALKELVDE